MEMEVQDVEGESEVNSKVDDWEVEPIERSVLPSEVCRPLVERYYASKWCVDLDGPCDDYQVLVHSNRVMVLTLGESHFLRKEHVTRVDWGSLAECRSTGKWKRGATRLTRGSLLAQVSTVEQGNERTRTLKACVSGKLLEVNNNLTETPSLLLEKSQSSGFLAIVLPDLHSLPVLLDTLLDRTQYLQALALRNSPPTTETLPQTA